MAGPSSSMTAEPAAREGTPPVKPESRGMDATPVIVDPDLDAIPGAAQQVQQALAAFVDATRSFPELQKGSRPAAPDDVEVIAPVLQPLMAEKAWADAADQIRSGWLPVWYPGGNPAVLFAISDPDIPKHLIPNDDGYTFTHSGKNPMTLSVADTGEPGTYVGVDGADFQMAFTNTLGEVVVIRMTMDYVFTPGADGAWDVWQWNGVPEYFIADTQEKLDSLPEF